MKAKHKAFNVHKVPDNKNCGVSESVISGTDSNSNMLDMMDSNVTENQNSIIHSNEPSNDSKLVSETDDNSHPSGMLNCTDASINVVSETDDKSNITNEDAWIEKHRIKKSYVLFKKTSSKDEKKTKKKDLVKRKSPFKTRNSGAPDA